MEMALTGRKSNIKYIKTKCGHQEILNLNLKDVSESVSASKHTWTETQQQTGWHQAVKGNLNIRICPASTMWDCQRQ